MARALANRNFRLWAGADLVSVTGSWMQVFGLNWVVMARTGSATAVGVSVLVSALPALLLGPWAGALADRLDPRRIIVAGQSTHAVLAVVLAFLVWAQAPIGTLYLLTAVSGLIGVVEGPALGRFGSQVVPRADLGNALAIGSLINASGRVLGMSSAGIIAAAAGEPALFLINAVSFVAVIATIRAVRTAELHPLAISPPHRAGALAGLRHVRADRTLLTLFALGFVLSGLGRNYQVTMAAMAEGPLQAGAAGYGTLSAVFAAGTVLGGLVAARLRELPVRVLFAAAAVTSALQAVSGLAPGLVGFAVVILPIAAGAVLIDTVMSTRVQLDSAEDMRGRVLAVQATVAAAAGAVGAPLLGWLCEHLGPAPALTVAGLCALVATGLAVANCGRARVAPARLRFGPGEAGTPAGPHRHTVGTHDRTRAHRGRRCGEPAVGADPDGVAAGLAHRLRVLRHRVPRHRGLHGVARPSARRPGADRARTHVGEGHEQEAAR